MKILAGPSSQLLASRVAREIKCDLALIEFKKFPDGELYLRVTDEMDEEALIIQSTVTNDDVISLLQLIDAASDCYARVVIPYFGYARQDKQFKPGEPVSARVIAQSIVADEVFLINVHNTSTLGHFKLRTKKKAINLSAARIVGQHLKGMHFGSPLVISPDEGAVQLVRDTARAMEAEYDVLVKKRLSSEEVIIQPKHLAVDNKEVVIVDDMISTGGTMSEAIKLLKSQGAREVHVACVHPVLSQNARLLLYNAGVESIIATDTIEHAESIISVAPLIKEGLQLS